MFLHQKKFTFLGPSAENKSAKILKWESKNVKNEIAEINNL